MSLFATSIDRITIVGADLWYKTNVDIKSDEQTCAMEEFLNNDVSVEKVTFAKYPYRKTYHLVDGSVLQEAEYNLWRSGVMKRWRFDFNPKHTKTSKATEKAYLGVIKQLTAIECTRVDVAFDFSSEMENWNWIDHWGRNRCVFYNGRMDIETIYIGAKDSDLRLRFYNKAKQSKIQDRTWWRLEAQIRGDLAREYQKTFEMNPFEGLSAYEITYPITDKSIKLQERAMLDYLIKYPDSWGELSKGSRLKYKELLENLEQKQLIDLESIWRQQKNNLHSELVSWLNFIQAKVA